MQRAMDIYKRQRVSLSLPMANGGKVDIILAPRIEEQVPVNDLDVGGEPVLDHNEEISDVQMLNLDEEKVKVHASISPEKENLEVACSQELAVHAHTSNLKLESASQALSHDIPEEPMMIFSGDKVDKMSSEMVNSEDKQGDFVSTPDDVPNADQVLPTDGQKMDENRKMEGSNTYNRAEEGEGVGNAICGSVIFSDGSPKASGALMPGSNEPESVILRRIHHSPESTH